jgi:hypothetical protein
LAESDRESGAQHVKKLNRDVTISSGKMFFANLREKRSLIFYCRMKLLWAREEYVTCYSRKIVQGRYLEVERDEEGIREWNMPPM